MSRTERQRLAADLARDPVLRAALAPALAAGVAPAEAAALLKAHGYHIDMASLPAPLDDAALDGVAGGYNPTRNFTSPFDP